MITTMGTEHIAAVHFEDWPAAAKPGDRIVFNGELAAAPLEGSNETYLRLEWLQ